MSQNKTVIQGLEPSSALEGGINSSFYSRNSGHVGRGTIVSGMGGNVENRSVQAGEESKLPQPSSKNTPTGKPVVGFLFSISRTAAGEYWPLHIGQNIIGKASSCDIVLSEGTVSNDHAVLVVRKMKNPEKIIASISDARSTNGTMINGESLGFSAVECKNGDIITVGDNYELYLILIDSPTLGLSVSKDFIVLSKDDALQDETDDILPPGFTNPGSAFQPTNEPTFPYGGGSPGGTIGLDGSGGIDKGGTIGM